MIEHVCIIGLDPTEYSQIEARLDVLVLAHETLPGIVVDAGQLWVEAHRGPRLIPVGKVVYPYTLIRTIR